MVRSTANFAKRTRGSWCIQLKRYSPKPFCQRSRADQTNMSSVRQTEFKRSDRTQSSHNGQHQQHRCYRKADPRETTRTEAPPIPSDRLPEQNNTGEHENSVHHSNSAHNMVATHRAQGGAYSPTFLEYHCGTDQSRSVESSGQP